MEHSCKKYSRIVIPYIFRENIFQECEVVYLRRIGEFIILTKNNEDQTVIRKILDELDRVVINIEIRKISWIINCNFNA